MSTAEWILRGRDDGHGAALSQETLTDMEQRFLALLADYCLLARIPDPVAVLSGQEFSIQGVDFRLMSALPKQPGMLGIWCDYGDVPEEAEEACFRKLLESNSARFDGISPVMGLCDETGQVVSSARVPVQSLTAESLDMLVRSMAQDALAWQGSLLPH